MSALEKRVEEEALETSRDLIEKPEAKLLRVFEAIENDAAERKTTYLKDSAALANGE